MAKPTIARRKDATNKFKGGKDHVAQHATEVQGVEYVVSWHPSDGFYPR